MTARLRIVIVEPREAGNVGAVARVMKNFGFLDLVVVGEEVPVRSNALWWSSGAEDLLESARAVPSLQEALEDVHFSVATTSSRGRPLEQVLTPAEVSARRHEMASDQIMAVVLGREDHGLSSAEAMLCQAISVVPTSPASPVMNLAQAVGVYCYELSQPARGAIASQAVLAPDELVPQGLLERFHERAASLLLEVGFLQEKNPDRVYEEVRRLMTRERLTTREVSILLAMIRQIEWKLHALAAGE